MRYLIFLSIIIPLAFNASTASAQEATPGKSLLITKQNINSANTKDILTNFFQLAINNIAGDNKQLSFSSSPFAVLSKFDPGMMSSSRYKNGRPLRRLNFDIGLNLDSSYHFNGFTSAIKFAIIDKMDVTSNPQFETYLEQDSLRLSIQAAFDNAILLLSSRPDKASTEVADYKKQVKRFFIDGTATYRNIPDSVKLLVDTVLMDTANYPQLNILRNWLNTYPDSSIVKTQRQIANNYIDFMKQAPLWTVGFADTTYNNQFSFSRLKLFTEFTKGIGRPKPGNNWEINAVAALNFSNDSLYTHKNLKRLVFNFSPSLNYVFRTKNNQYSYLEFQFGAELLHNFNQLYIDEQRTTFCAAGTIRFRVFKDFWIPLSIKYNPMEWKSIGLFRFEI